jgi:hypothetical protein
MSGKQSAYEMRKTLQYAAGYGATMPALCRILNPNVKHLKPAGPVSTGDYAVAVRFGQRIRNLVGWAFIKIFDTHDEASAGRHNVGAAMAANNVLLPEGWEMQVYDADDDLFLLALFDATGKMLVLI